jgi:uncharacterized membrane protein
MKGHFETGKMIYLSLCFSVALVFARVVYTGELHYIFIIWNLFLAWVPFAISNVLRQKYNASPWLQGLLIFGWLIFFPNAPYIITDFMHLGESPIVPLWFDVFLLFTASWNGLLLGVLSLFKIEKFLENKFSSRLASFCIVICLFLCGFGVYAGRFLRWNSWEIFTDPKNIMEDAVQRLLNPHEHPATWGVTMLIGMMLMIVYYTLKNLRGGGVQSK